MKITLVCLAARGNCLIGKVKLRIQIGDRPYTTYSTGIRLLKSEWIDSDSLSKDRSLNKRIKSVVEDIYRVQEDMAKSEIETITSDSVVNTYQQLKKLGLKPTYENIKSINKKYNNEPTPTLKEIIDNFYNLQLKTWTGTTPETYKSIRNQFYKYLDEQKLSQIKANDFDKSKLLAFVNYLKVEKELKPASIKLYCILIQGSYSEAINLKQVERNDILDYEHKGRSPEFVQPLTETEINLLMSIDFYNLSEEQKSRLKIKKDIGNEQFEVWTQVRDMFMLCSFTGFHTADRLNLRMAHQKKIQESDFLINNRQKTKKVFNVKLHPIAKEIIERYGGIDYLPKLDNKQMFYRLQQIKKIVGFEKKLTSKIARQNFADKSLNDWFVGLDATAMAMGINPSMVRKYGKMAPETVNKAYNFKDDAA